MMNVLSLSWFDCSRVLRDFFPLLEWKAMSNPHQQDEKNYVCREMWNIFGRQTKKRFEHGRQHGTKNAPYSSFRLVSSDWASIRGRRIVAHTHKNGGGRRKSRFEFGALPFVLIEIFVYSLASSNGGNYAGPITAPAAGQSPNDRDGRTIEKAKAPARLCCTLLYIFLSSFSSSNSCMYTNGARMLLESRTIWEKEKNSLSVRSGVYRCTSITKQGEAIAGPARCCWW